MLDVYERRVGRKEAAQFLTERGYRTAPAILAKLARVGHYVRAFAVSIVFSRSAATLCALCSACILKRARVSGRPLSSAGHKSAVR